ncbi:uncharacterized protein Bfra_008920 [Botrytis fragariae]|uniref:Uncharacterized protein n=1 Tax=Botrytis fragariae TaxID=1964551 RepID=A0A8H6AR18_9HELO|nr:uncharacterized protein Bfra_008920 [Botrytis fragariae]KAF5871894.1 hypothetical protein Bfra_008920 [Botrytis fragariae]
MTSGSYDRAAILKGLTADIFDPRFALNASLFICARAISPKQEAMSLGHVMSFAYNIWDLGQAVAGFLPWDSMCTYVGSSKMELLSGSNTHSRQQRGMGILYVYI